MFSEQRSEFKTVEPARLVAKFFQDLYWNHRLHTPEIDAFRMQTFPTRVKEWADAVHLDTRKSVAIPLGSTRTLPTGSSDIDLLVIEDAQDEDPSRYYQTPNLIERLPSSVNSKYGVEVIESYKTNYLDNKYIKLSNTLQQGKKLERLIDSGYIAQIMITPDELAVGNVALLHEQRLIALDFIEAVYNIHAYWDSPDSEVNRIFQTYITHWHKGEDGSKRQIREHRLKVAVEKVMAGINYRHTDAPNHLDTPGKCWADQFYRHLHNLRLPPFTQFSQVVRKNNGALSWN